MLNYTNLRIPLKILVLIALLAMVSVSAVIFATDKMRYIDNTYGDLIDGEVKASIALVRAGRDVIEITRSVYRLIEGNTAESNAKALKDIEDSKSFFAQKIKSAIKRLPSRKQEIQAIEEMFNKAMSESCQATIRLGQSFEGGEKKTASQLMQEQCDPSLTNVSSKFSSLTNQIIKETDQASNNALAVTDDTIRSTYIVVLTGLLLSFLLSIYLARTNISLPINAIVHVLKELAQNNFDVTVSGASRRDEIGDIARAAAIFKDQGIESLRLREEQEKAKARAQEDLKSMQNKLAQEFEASVKNIVVKVATAAARFEDTANDLVATMSHTTQTASLSASGATETSANVQFVASAVNDLTASIREISSQLNSSNTMIHDSVSKIELIDRQGVSLQNTTERVETVIELISTIANQINLLALNATIESARAGEAGKGFAVVANEVKNLANQTDKSLRDVESVIKEMKEASHAISRSIQEISDAMRKISESSSTIAAAVEEQSATTNEIASNMKSAAQRSQQICKNLDDVTSTTAHAESSSGVILQSSKDLSEDAEKLESEVKKFLHRIVVE